MNKEFITLDNGLEVGYCLWGSDNGTTLLFLHGLGSTGASFNQIASLLSRQYRILAFDLPGHGGSTFFREEKFFSIEALSEWVLTVLKRLGINEIHIAGHSIGGNIGLAAAKEEGVKSLILLDGGYMRSSSIPENSLEEEVRMAERHCGNYMFSSWKHYEADLKKNGLSEPLIELAKLSMKSDGDQIKLILPSDIAGFYMKQHFLEPSGKTLTGIKVPVLLLRSTLPEELNNHREKEADRLSEYLNIVVEPVKGSSHDIYWEHPKTVSASLSQWIDKYE